MFISFQKDTNNSAENNRVENVFRSNKIEETRFGGVKDLIYKPKRCKRDILQVFETKGSTELFISNCYTLKGWTSYLTCTIFHHY